MQVTVSLVAWPSPMWMIDGARARCDGAVDADTVQAKEFVKFVRAHVMVVARENPDGNPGKEKETVRFDWEASHAAV